MGGPSPAKADGRACGGVLSEKVRELFAAAAAGVCVEVQVGIGPGVVGDVLYGDSTAFQYAAALPLQSAPFEEAVFSRRANRKGFFNGLVFFDPGEVDPHPAIEAVWATGYWAAGRSFTRVRENDFRSSSWS